MVESLELSAGLRGVVRRLRYRARCALGRDVFGRVEVSLPSVRLGSDYGGWITCVEALNAKPGPAVIYSAGVGTDLSFDLALHSATGVDVHTFDPTPRSVEWMRSQALPDGFRHHRVGLAGHDDEVMFRAPSDPAHVSFSMEDPDASDATRESASSEEGMVSLPVKRLATMMRELGHDTVHLLKLDIEGAEYGVLHDIATHGPKPLQLLVEFHHDGTADGVAQLRDVLETLYGVGYRIFAVTPYGREFSFVLPEALPASLQRPSAARGTP